MEPSQLIEPIQLIQMLPPLSYSGIPLPVTGTSLGGLGSPDLMTLSKEVSPLSLVENDTRSSCPTCWG